MATTATKKLYVTSDPELKQHFEKQAGDRNMKVSSYLLSMVELAEKAGFTPGMTLPDNPVEAVGVAQGDMFKEYICICGQTNIINHAYPTTLTCYICEQAELTFVRDIPNRWPALDDEEDGEVTDLEDDEEEEELRPLRPH